MKEIEELHFSLVFRKKEPPLPLSTGQTSGKNHIGKGKLDAVIHD